MGGAVLYSAESSLVFEYDQIPLKTKMRRWVYFSGSLIKRIFRDFSHILKLAFRIEMSYRVSNYYEYSICKTSHYDTLPESIHKISAVYALLNLYSLNRFDDIRKENCQNLALICGYTEKTFKDKFPLVSPAFLPILKEVDSTSIYPAPVKTPYAKHNVPELCCKNVFAFKVNVPYVRYQ